MRVQKTEPHSGRHNANDQSSMTCFNPKQDFSPEFPSFYLFIASHAFPLLSTYSHSLIEWCFPLCHLLQSMLKFYVWRSTRVMHNHPLTRTQACLAWMWWKNEALNIFSTKVETKSKKHKLIIKPNGNWKTKKRESVRYCARKNAYNCVDNMWTQNE